MKWNKEMKIYTPYDNFVNTGIWRTLLFEMILNAFAPYPFLDGIKYIEEIPDIDCSATYEINDVLSIMTFNRVYLLLRCYLYFTVF